jgi:fumarylacetoacetate (FAA) hydrolase family protein
MAELLPHDWHEATLVGRIDLGDGPSPIVITGGRVLDVSRTAATVSNLFETWSGNVRGKDLGALQDLALRPAWEQPAGKARLLSPIDLQCVLYSGNFTSIYNLTSVIDSICFILFH